MFHSPHHDAVSASKAHTHKSILQTHSTLRRPTIDCYLPAPHGTIPGMIDERPYVSSVDTNAPPRFSRTVDIHYARAHALLIYMRALPPSPSAPSHADPRSATCVVSCRQAPDAQAGGSRGEGTGDFCSNSRGGRHWRRRRRWAESASPPRELEAEDVGRD